MKIERERKRVLKEKERELKERERDEDFIGCKHETRKEGKRDLLNNE